MTKLSLTDINLTNRKSGVKTIIPKGTRLILEFREGSPELVTCAMPDGNKFNVAANRAKTYFGAPFTPEPSLKTLERWSDDGIARSLTGGKCEPDGFSTDGAPAWLLALGLV